MEKMAKEMETEKREKVKKAEKEKKRESNRILGIEEDTDEVKEDKDLNWEDNSNSSDPSFITTQSMVITSNTGNKDTTVATPKVENKAVSPKQ
jgi:hypothetical protein